MGLAQCRLALVFRDAPDRVEEMTTVVKDATLAC